MQKEANELIKKRKRSAAMKGCGRVASTYKFSEPNQVDQPPQPPQPLVPNSNMPPMEEYLLWFPYNGSKTESLR